LPALRKGFKLVLDFFKEMTMSNTRDDQNPREIPTRQDPEKVNPIKDPDVIPNNDNPSDPKQDDSGL
jgi:hypothetical protein